MKANGINNEILCHNGSDQVGFHRIIQPSCDLHLISIPMVEVESGLFSATFYKLDMGL